MSKFCREEDYKDRKAVVAKCEVCDVQSVTDCNQHVTDCHALNAAMKDALKFVIAMANLYGEGKQSADATIYRIRGGA